MVDGRVDILLVTVVVSVVTDVGGVLLLGAGVIDVSPASININKV